MSLSSLVWRGLETYQEDGLSTFLFSTSNYLLRELGYELSRTDTDTETKEIPPHFDDLFTKIYERNSHLTSYTPAMTYSSYQAAKYVAQNNVPGAIVESGAFRGGCSIIMAETLFHMGVTNKDIYLYDTFSGYPEPSSKDETLSNEKSANEIWQSKNDDDSSWMEAPYDDVKQNVESSLYPTEKFNLVRGKIQETVPENAPAEISVLRLDTGWYDATKFELEHLYPRVPRMGVLVINNYGYWRGCKNATDDYFATVDEPPLLFSTVDDQRYAGVKPD